MSSIPLYLVPFALSYLVGSLPFGLWIVRILKGIDIREHGSGNIGSTNVGRVCGTKAAAGVFILDVLKGLLPPLIAHRFGLSSLGVVLCALLAVIGHNFSIFINFKGGKGIATSLGALLGVAPFVGLGALAVWIVLILATQTVSTSSIGAACMLPPLCIFFYRHDPPLLSFCCVACVMAIAKHKANIARLKLGTEPKIRFPWSAKPDLAVVNSLDSPPTAPSQKAQTSQEKSSDVP